MSYEDAPATKMLATHCTMCGKPLLDADSVTAGVGPVCRKELRSIPDDVRVRANKIIYECARESVTVEELSAAVVELALLGCDKIAERISERAGRITITITADLIAVQAPYNKEFIRACRKIRSRRWAGKEIGTTFKHADALTALRTLRFAYDRIKLIRLVEGDRERFFSPDHPGLQEVFESIAAAHVAERVETALKAEPSKCPKWRGSPTKLRDSSWGVVINSRGPDAPIPGDIVQVRASGGKEWPAKLVRRERTAAWGQIWQTEKP